jgi:hypothetical protein
MVISFFKMGVAARVDHREGTTFVPLPEVCKNDADAKRAFRLHLCHLALREATSVR